MSSGIYSSKTPELGELGNVNNENVGNNDIIQYNTVSTNWENKSDFTVDEIDCRVLRVSETADVGGRLACVGVASFVNDEFIFQNGVSNLGDTLYIDNVNNRVGINKAVPEEDLDVDGNIQLAGANDVKINFYDSTGDYSHGKLVMNDDGTGSEFQVHTREVGSAISQKLTINKVGAIGIGQGEEKYGTANSILTSNGESFLPTWSSTANLDSLTLNNTSTFSTVYFGTSNTEGNHYYGKDSLASRIRVWGRRNSDTYRWSIYERGTEMLTATNFNGSVFRIYHRTLSSLSDDRYKHNEEPILNALQTIDQLRPQKYHKTAEMKEADYNGPLEEGTYDIESGFIAQEVKLIPELNHLVDVRDDEHQTHSINYNGIIPYNTAAIKELHSLVQAQQAQIDTLTSKLNELLD